MAETLREVTKASFSGVFRHPGGGDPTGHPESLGLVERLWTRLWRGQAPKGAWIPACFGWLVDPIGTYLEASPRDGQRVIGSAATTNWCGRNGLFRENENSGEICWIPWLRDAWRVEPLRGGRPGGWGGREAKGLTIFEGLG